jgi:hypothetical protein
MLTIADVFDNAQSKGVPSPEGNPKLKNLFNPGDILPIDVLENVRYVPIAPWDWVRLRILIDQNATMTLAFCDGFGQELGPGARATGALTFSGQPANGETVVLNGKTYNFRTTLSDTDGYVQIGASTAESIANLVAAVTLADGAGTAYAASTTLHPTMYAVGTATVFRVWAKAPGTAGNALTTVETITNATGFTATLAGGAASDIGADPVAITADTPTTIDIPGVTDATPEHVGEPWLKVYLSGIAAPAAVTYFEAMGWYGA